VSSPAAAPRQAGGRQLFARQAHRDGRSVAIIRAFAYDDHCVVETEVFPAQRGTERTATGPYTFADPEQARKFVAELVESLTYLGCDVRAAQ
jgi:hypothetical protein